MRMPFVDSESPFELVVKRSQCALALFNPFRAVEDLVVDSTDSAGWVDAFMQWQPTRSSFTCEIMANMDDYFRAAKQAMECRESSGDVDNSSDIDEINGTRDDVEAALDRAAACELLGSAVAGSDDFCHIFDDDSGSANSGNDDENAVGSTLESSMPIFPNSGSCVVSVGYQSLWNGTAQKTVGTVGDLRSRCPSFDISVDELHRFVSDTTKDETEPQRSDQFRNERPTEVVELITSVLDGNREWSRSTQPQTQPPPPLGSYASIEDVARAFTLNLRQYAAFTLITISLLRRFLCQELGGLHGNCGGYRTNNFEARFRDDQLLMFLGGASGTGKSRVIDAVDAVCASWHRDNSVVKAALTGKAATLIGGRTLASVKMGLQRAINEKHFTPLDLLVIDEVSMMSITELLWLDKLLRRYKQVPNVLFGGVHIVLVGDFLQMPPVKADPIHVDPTEKSKVKTTDIEGFELWRKL